MSGSDCYCVCSGKGVCPYCRTCEQVPTDFITFVRADSDFVGCEVLIGGITEINQSKWNGAAGIIVGFDPKRGRKGLFLINTGEKQVYMSSDYIHIKTSSGKGREIEEDTKSQMDRIRTRERKRLEEELKDEEEMRELRKEAKREEEEANFGTSFLIRATESDSPSEEERVRKILQEFSRDLSLVPHFEEIRKAMVGVTKECKECNAPLISFRGAINDLATKGRDYVRKVLQRVGDHGDLYAFRGSSCEGCHLAKMKCLHNPTKVQSTQLTGAVSAGSLPVLASLIPSVGATASPTLIVSGSPSMNPTVDPTVGTENPTGSPSEAPSKGPATEGPTMSPTQSPVTLSPTGPPRITDSPTSSPTFSLCSEGCYLQDGDCVWCADGGTWNATCEPFYVYPVPSTQSCRDVLPPLCDYPCRPWKSRYTSVKGCYSCGINATAWLDGYDTPYCDVPGEVVRAARCPERSTAPTVGPSVNPSIGPSQLPTVSPSWLPTKSPSAPPKDVGSPSVSPSWLPTRSPSTALVVYQPTLGPTFAPSWAPSLAPTGGAVSNSSNYSYGLFVSGVSNAEPLVCGVGSALLLMVCCLLFCGAKNKQGDGMRGWIFFTGLTKAAAFSFSDILPNLSETQIFELSVGAFLVVIIVIIISMWCTAVCCHRRQRCCTIVSRRRDEVLG